jgi:hypothetical protein
MTEFSGIKDESNVLISSMGAAWTTQAYPMGQNTMLSVHLAWTGTPVGTLYLDYSSERCDQGDTVSSWVNKTEVDVDGTFNEEMFLDAQLPVASYRLRFVSTSGTGVLSSWTFNKRGH